MEDNTASSTSTEVSPAGVERVDGTATAGSASSTDSVVPGHSNESSDESTAVLSEVREVFPLPSLRVFLLSSAIRPLVAVYDQIRLWAEQRLSILIFVVVVLSSHGFLFC